MKTVLSAIFALGFTCSIQAQNAAAKQQINSNIAAYIKRNAHDPGSYQFVSTIFLDTLRRSDKIEKEIYREMSEQRGRVDRYKILMQGDDKGQIAKTQKEIENSKHEIDSLMIVMEDMRTKKRPDPSVGYLFIHRYRSKNQYNALVLGTCKVTTDKAFKITSLKELE